MYSTRPNLLVKKNNSTLSVFDRNDTRNTQISWSDIHSLYKTINTYFYSLKSALKPNILLAKEQSLECIYAYTLVKDSIDTSIVSLPNDSGLSRRKLTLGLKTICYKFRTQKDWENWYKNTPEVLKRKLFSAKPFFSFQYRTRARYLNMSTLFIKNPYYKNDGLVSLQEGLITQSLSHISSLGSAEERKKIFIKNNPPISPQGGSERALQRKKRPSRARWRVEEAPPWRVIRLFCESFNLNPRRVTEKHAHLAERILARFNGDTSEVYRFLRDRAVTSRFLTGKLVAGFKASLGFLLKESTIENLLAGLWLDKGRGEWRINANLCTLSLHHKNPVFEPIKKEDVAVQGNSRLAKTLRSLLEEYG